MVGLKVLSVLIIGSLYTKPNPDEFLNLYGARLQALGPRDLDTERHESCDRRRMRHVVVPSERHSPRIPFSLSPSATKLPVSS